MLGSLIRTETTILQEKSVVNLSFYLKTLSVQMQDFS